MMKRVLIISFSFPPASGSGVLRTLKFVKYLPTFNWVPIVLSVREKYANKIDKELLNEIPKSTVIFRTIMSDPLAWILDTRNKIKLFLKKNSDKSNKPYNPKKPVEEISSNKNSVQKLFTDWLSFPDRTIGWVPWALFRGITIIRKYNPQIIYSTSPPASAHIIGYYLKRYTKKPWIIDFRDPWDVEYLSRNKSNWRIKSELKLRNRILLSADRIIANTEALRDKICLSNPSIDKKNIVVIPNGFDPDDFKNINLKPRINNNECIISHIGELYPDGRKPDQFLIAISELIKETRLPKDSLKVYFIGDRDITPTNEFKSLVENLGLKDVVIVKDHISHIKSIEHLFYSDILLLLQTGKNFNLQIPAKVYEYIAAKKPILALTPDGETARFVKQYPLGIVVNPEDIQRIKYEIQNLLQKKGFPPQNNLDEFVSKYDRKKHTEYFANILNTLIKSDAQKN